MLKRSSSCYNLKLFSLLNSENHLDLCQNRNNNYAFRDIKSLKNICNQSFSRNSLIHSKHTIKKAKEVF